jgi:Flp pilus assembly protein TadD
MWFAPGVEPIPYFPWFAFSITRPMQPAATLPVDQIAAALQQGQPQDAERLVRIHLAAMPMDEDALLVLGICLQEQGRSAEAVEPYRQLTRMRPQSAIYWNNLGTVLRSAGEPRSAEDAYRRALELDPHDYVAAMNLGLLYLERGLYPQARDRFLQAHEMDPASPEARIYAAQMCFALDSRDRAELLLEPWPSWTDLPDDLALELAILMTHFGDAEEGTRIFERLLRENPHNLRVIAHLSTMFERVNRLDEARAMLARLPASSVMQDPALSQEILVARTTLAMREKDPAQARAIIEEMIAEQQRIRARPGEGNIWRQDNLYFPLAKVCDRQGDADATMRALARAHELQIELVRGSLPELLEPDAQPLHTATKWVSAEAHAAWPELYAPAMQDSPIFIVGFPRSGTTMLEQMLDAHPGLQAMDERAFLHMLVERMSSYGCSYPYDLGKLSAIQCDELRNLYWSLTARVAPRKEGQRLVDKNPLNMLRLPLINRLFPNAPVILALRHPCDVILSNYMQHFNSNTFAVLCSSLERLAQGYVTAMEFWTHHAQLLKPRLIHSRYEDLLDDFAGNVQRIGDFLHLDDAAPLMRFDQHAREKGFISTPSYNQVIEPPNKKAVDRWRRYHRYFEPVLPTLQPMLQRFGYDS